MPRLPCLTQISAVRELQSQLVCLEVVEYMRVLQDWREQPNKTVTSVLAHIEEAKALRGRALEEILKGVTSFHREIIRAEEGLVDVKWYELCVSAKKRFKRMQEIEDDHRKMQPYLEKRAPRLTNYPQALTTGQGQANQQLLKHLYKSFVAHFEAAIDHPKTVPFILQTLKELKDKFDGTFSAKVDRTDRAMGHRVTSIGLRLARESSCESKARMLSGEVSARELSEDEMELYFDQTIWATLKQLQREEVERNSGGYYEEMKKRISKDACEECRFCRKMRAYCEDQKQIRASDEPMTRLMRCNHCDKTWRD